MTQRTVAVRASSVNAKGMMWEISQNQQYRLGHNGFDLRQPRYSFTDSKGIVTVTVLESGENWPGLS